MALAVALNLLMLTVSVTPVRGTQYQWRLMRRPIETRGHVVSVWSDLI